MSQHNELAHLEERLDKVLTEVESAISKGPILMLPKAATYTRSQLYRLKNGSWADLTRVYNIKMTPIGGTPPSPKTIKARVTVVGEGFLEEMRFATNKEAQDYADQLATIINSPVPINGGLYAKERPDSQAEQPSTSEGIPTQP